jgi:tripartite-type tricarboxylate transporter receptor subunit TctC
MRLHKALVGVIAKPEVKALFDQEGSEVVANSPEEFRAYIVTERDRFARIVKAAGITVEEA